MAGSETIILMIADRARRVRYFSALAAGPQRIVRGFADPGDSITALDSCDAGCLVIDPAGLSSPALVGLLRAAADHPALVTLLLAITVMAITSVYVGERQLQSLADRAAGAAADTFTSVDRAGEGPPTPVLTHEAVVGSATSYLGTVGAFRDVSSLEVGIPTGSTDGTTAQVTLTAVVHPPVVNVVIPEGVPISATADARAVMRR